MDARDGEANGLELSGGDPVAKEDQQSGDCGHSSEDDCQEGDISSNGVAPEKNIQIGVCGEERGRKKNRVGGAKRRYQKLDESKGSVNSDGSASDNANEANEPRKNGLQKVKKNEKRNKEKKEKLKKWNVDPAELTAIIGRQDVNGNDGVTNKAICREGDKSPSRRSQPPEDSTQGSDMKPTSFTVGAQATDVIPTSFSCEDTCVHGDGGVSRPVCVQMQGHPLDNLPVPTVARKKNEKISADVANEMPKIELANIWDPDFGQDVDIALTQLRWISSSSSRSQISKGAGQSSNASTFINSVICFMGSGVLGLPLAFQHVGILGGLFGLCIITVVALHCMFLMVDIKTELLEFHKIPTRDYADIGFQAFGRVGQVVVGACIVLTQTGFCIAYLIFISSSLREVNSGISKRTWIILCMPFLILASWLRSMKALSKLSLFAVVSILIALFTVLTFDMLELGNDHHSDASYAGGSHFGNIYEGARDRTSSTVDDVPQHHDFGGRGPLVIVEFTGVPYFFGVCVYCFEGVGMVLPVLNGMQHPDRFKPVWGCACISVSLLYMIFGSLGYAAFRNDVSDAITSNLPRQPATELLKVSLCLGLLFTYPLMGVPVIEQIERRMKKTVDLTKWDASVRNAVRACFVIGTGIVAYMVPKFGVFISLVGASASAALAFVLPAMFSLKIRWTRQSILEKFRDFGCVIFGIAGGVVGTMSAISDMRHEFGH